MATTALVSPNKSTNVRSFIGEATGLGLRWLDRTLPELAAIQAERMFLTPRRHPRPAWEAALLESAQRGAVPYAGRWLPTWSWGEGPTVLLVHGWEGRGSQLGALVRPLVADGHRVLTLDFPGHGAAYGARSSAIESARVLSAIHGALGPIHAVVAHSMGGAATTMAYALSPFAERLALISVPRGPRRFFDQFADAFELSAETRHLAAARIAKRYGLALDEIDTAAFAKLVDVPTLVIHDRDDREVPFEDGGALAEALPRGYLLATEGLGHRRILRDARVIDDVRRFVASPQARSLIRQIEHELFDPALRNA